MNRVLRKIEELRRVNVEAGGSVKDILNLIEVEALLEARGSNTTTPFSQLTSDKLKYELAGEQILFKELLKKASFSGLACAERMKVI